MSFLDELLTTTRERIQRARATVSDDVLEQRIAGVEPPRGFGAALRGDAIQIIAEIKRATPGRGPLAPDLDASRVAAAYAEGGAAAISVLTEPDRFLGSLDDLGAARSAGLPTLRKDFIVDPFQVLEARAVGADAVLLIVRIVGPELDDLVAATHALGMDALVEVFSEDDVERALAAGAGIVGVNHRDLETFELDDERTAKLAPLLPDDVSLVGLSGVASRADVERLESVGCDAVLVGTSLVTADDPAAKLRELLGR